MTMASKSAKGSKTSKSSKSKSSKSVGPKSSKSAKSVKSVKNAKDVKSDKSSKFDVSKSSNSFEKGTKKGESRSKSDKAGNLINLKEHDIFCWGLSFLQFMFSILWFNLYMWAHSLDVK